MFKILANPNRLKIIKLLSDDRSMAVSDIAETIKISLKSTSKHLVIMNRVGLLEAESKAGKVFYKLSANAPVDFKSALRIFN